MSIPARIALGSSLALLALLSLACPPSSSSSSSTSTSTSTSTSNGCTHEGDRCTYAEGKIGLCTAKPNCQGDACLVCMSLH